MVFGVEVFLFVVVGYCEDIEVIFFQFVEVLVSVDVVLVVVVVVGGGGVVVVEVVFVQVFVGDEVDYFVDGIGVVQCGGVVVQYFDLVDGGEGNGVEIYCGVVDGIVCQVLVVEQYQGFVCVDFVQVGE